MGTAKVEDELGLGLWGSLMRERRAFDIRDKSKILGESFSHHQTLPPLVLVK